MNKKRSILLLGNYPPPFGGVPTHLKYLAPYLAQKDWHVHVLSMVSNKILLSVPPQTMDGCIIHRPSILDRVIRLANPNCVPHEYSLLKDRKKYSWKSSIAILSLAAYVKRIVHQYDIQLISAYHLYSAGLVSFLIAQEKGIPFVTTIFGEIYSQLDFFRARKDDVEMILNASARNFSPSKHCAKSVEMLDIVAVVEPIYYGIDTSCFSPKQDGDSVRADLGISFSDPVVIFVGRMVREMGLHVLLAAVPKVLKKIEEARFLIVGKSDELVDSARQVAKKYSGNVFVTPNLSMEKLPMFYAAADLAVVPSTNDRACLGLAIAEAMATEKPVVVSDIGGGPEVVENGVSGILVPPNDSQALAESIISLLNASMEVRAAMGKAGRQSVLELFDKDLVNCTMEAAFSEVLG